MIDLKAMWAVRIDSGTGDPVVHDISHELTSTIIAVGHERVWFLSEMGALDALHAEALMTDASSDREWNVWPSHANNYPSATLDPRTGDIWVGNHEGSVTHIPIDQTTD